jgi:myo-inositol 2-dehydrogenase/D-chiro-inositol 1-dehydrogenase
MIRVAVLGAGRIGQIHAANVAANPRAKLIAVADPIDASGRKLAERLGCEASTDAEAVIARKDVDAVVIGTPSDTHAHLMLLAARAGKAVLCEKPVDNNLAKADEAVAELTRLKAKVMMAFNRRFDPSNVELRRAIDAGDIGEVRQVIITSRDPGLPPRDYVAHSTWLAFFSVKSRSRSTLRPAALSTRR